MKLGLVNTQPRSSNPGGPGRAHELAITNGGRSDFNSVAYWIAAVAERLVPARRGLGSRTGPIHRSRRCIRGPHWHGSCRIHSGDSWSHVSDSFGSGSELEAAPGIGTALISAGMNWLFSAGAESVLVGTAAADIENLRLYQRLGFRVLRVERDAFTVDRGYSRDLNVGGIPIRDRVWLSVEAPAA